MNEHGIRQISAHEIFSDLKERLGFHWMAGQEGEQRVIDMNADVERRRSLVSYLNIIYPNKIQIIGNEELRYLESLSAHQRAETIDKIIAYQPIALLFTRNQTIPGDLKKAAQLSHTPIWASPKQGHELLTYIQYYLARVLARKTTLHGTFMEVYSIGVLVTGDSGVGKSELALELITRGHRLIADDAPEFTQIAPDVLDGTCPEMLMDLLEVRGLGILNVYEMFGHTAVKRNKYLRLIIHLTQDDVLSAADAIKRITGISENRSILDVTVPQITMPVAPGRNLAVLVEAAVRHYLLKSKGIDPAQIFIDRQAHQMKKHAL